MTNLDDESGVKPSNLKQENIKKALTKESKEPEPEPNQTSDI